jgi:hypothetical protein
MIQTENKDFSRDITTKALLNTNTGALAEHKYRIAQATLIKTLCDRIEKLEVDYAEIKKSLENR